MRPLRVRVPYNYMVAYYRLVTSPMFVGGFFRTGPRLEGAGIYNANN